MDGEPPAKRARRTDSAAMWDKNNADGTASARPPTKNREHRVKNENDDSQIESHAGRRDRPETKRRSRSPRDRDRDRGYRERDRGGAHDRDRDGHRDRSRSRDRNRSARDHKSDRKRSRSPHRNGTSTPSSRPRSPPSNARARVKPEDRDVKPLRDVKPALTNGSARSHATTTAAPKSKPESGMDVDDPDDADDILKRMMGFSTFKSTQNTKVPGNRIYGVRKEKKTEYRQYMNRVGGFNRPLSPGK